MFDKFTGPAKRYFYSDIRDFADKDLDALLQLEVDLKSIENVALPYLGHFYSENHVMFEFTHHKYYTAGSLDIYFEKSDKESLIFELSEYCIEFEDIEDCIYQQEAATLAFRTRDGNESDMGLKIFSPSTAIFEVVKRIHFVKMEEMFGDDGHIATLNIRRKGKGNTLDLILQRRYFQR